MASKFASSVIEHFSDDRSLSIEAALDAELQEVRQVLTLLKSSRHGCWCDSAVESNTPHLATCQRARDLMLKLEVRP